MIPLIFLLSLIPLVNSLFANIGPRFRKLSTEESVEMARVCGTLQYPSHDFPMPNAHFIEQLRSRVAKYPWAVSISINGKNKLGGALISPYHILTAAHGFLVYTSYYTKCSARGYKSLPEVQELDVSYGGVCIRGIDSKLPNHPFCTQPDVIRNKSKFHRSSPPHLSAVCWNENPEAAASSRMGKNLRGELREDGLSTDHDEGNMRNKPTICVEPVATDSSPLLHEATMVHAPHCPRPENDYFPSQAPDMLCAVSQNTTDFWAPRTCHGDSGSGMQQRDLDGRARLVALTSFGTPGCPADELARFTKLEPYLSEICQETGICYTVPESAQSNNLPFKVRV